MRRTASWLLAAALLAVVVPSADAAKRKPMSGTYSVTLPVPYPLEGSSGNHCTEGVDGATRAAKNFKFPAQGAFDATMRGFAGDWVMELYDSKGRLVATAASLDLTSGTRTLKWKKKRAGSETMTLAVCNFGGTPQATVQWKFVFS